MSILVDGETKVICQGITGSAGAFHTKGCLEYGTRMVGGVTPGKGGGVDGNGLPIFNTVCEAVEATGAEASMIFVPPAFAGDAILEAASAGVRVIVAVTEGIPTLDMVKVKAVLGEYVGVYLVGPNCPGVITPSGGGMGCKIGIMPGYIHRGKSEAETGKAVGIISRSGTLTYEAVWQCSSLEVGQTTCVGIGGDPVKGVNFIELLDMFEDANSTNPDSDVIVDLGALGEYSQEYIRQISLMIDQQYILGDFWNSEQSIPVYLPYGSYKVHESISTFSFKGHITERGLNYHHDQTIDFQIERIPT